MTQPQIFLIPPTFGDYTTIAYSNDYNPNKYFSFTIGRLGYVTHIQQPINSVNTPLIINHSTKKENNDPHPSQSTISRYSTDKYLKETCFYLYYLFLLLDSKSEIILHSGERKISSDDDILKNFICELISVNDQIIFNEKQKYFIVKDEVKKFNTIQFDDETNIPIVNQYKRRGNYSFNESCRIQQHILIQLINKLLIEKNLYLDYYIKKPAPTFVSSIHLKQFVDIDENNNFILIDKKQKEYETLIESLFQFFTYFIDNVKGITKKIIIGNTSCQPTEIKTTEDCIFIGRDKFIDLIDQMRKSSKTIEDLIQ